MAGTTGIVQGKNCLFEVNLGAGYKPVVCAKGFTANFQTEIKETTSRGSGAFKEFDYKAISYNITLTGLIKVVELDGDPIFFDLEFFQRSFIELPYRAKFINDAGNMKQIQGVVIVQNTNFNAQAGQLADTTAELLGTGSYNITDGVDNTCSNSIETAEINEIEVENGESGLIIGNTADLEVVITALADPDNSIYRFDYWLDSNDRNSEFTGGEIPVQIATIVSGSMTVGSHTLHIVPVCENGYDGTEFIVNFTKSSPI